MVNLVPIGPREILMAYGYFCLWVYGDKSCPPIMAEEWDVTIDDEIKEYTQTLCGDSQRHWGQC